MAPQLDALLAHLTRALGDRLVAVYTYGSDFARGPQASRGRLLVLVDTLDATLLDAVLPANAAARAQGVKLRLDTASHVLRCADVLPVFALELLETRQLVHGADALTMLAVEPEHLILRLEQALRVAHRQLLQGYLQARDDLGIARELRVLIRRLMPVLRGLAMVHGLTRPEPRSPQSDATSVLHRVVPDDLDLWKRLLHFAEFLDSVDHSELVTLYAEALGAFERLVVAVDRRD